MAGLHFHGASGPKQIDSYRVGLMANETRWTQEGQIISQCTSHETAYEDHSAYTAGPDVTNDEHAEIYSRI